MGSRTARVLAASFASVVLVAFWVTLAVREPDDTSPPSVDGTPGTEPDVARREPPLPGIAADCSRPVDVDVNAMIAAAPDGSALVLGTEACYGIDGSLVIEGKSNFTLDGAGATVKALTRGGAQRPTIDVRGGTNVSVVDLVVEGAFPGPPDDGLPGNGPHTSDETRTQHGVRLRSVQGAAVRNVRSSATGGECVMVTSGADAALGPVGGPSADVVVERLECGHTGRHGVTVVAGERVVVRDSEIADVYGCGISIEPEAESQVARDIRVEKVRFRAVRSAAVCNGGQGFSPNVGDISVVANRMTEPPATCAGVVHVVTPSHHQAAGRTRSGYRFVDNEFLSLSYGFFLSGVSDVEMSGNSLEREQASAYACADYSRDPPELQPALDLRNVQGLRASGNRWSGYDEVARVDPASSDVQPLG